MADSISSSSGPKPNNVIEGTEVFSRPNIELYLIAPHQHVATPWKVTTVKIITANQTRGAQDAINQSQILSTQASPSAYIEAEDWFCPLIPNQSIVFRTAQGHYIFPDLTSTSGSAVGFALPSPINPEEKNIFESLLLNLCGMQFFPSEPPTLQTYSSQNEDSNAIDQHQQNIDFSTPTANLVTQIADGVMAVAQVASRGISMSVAKTVQLLDKGTNYAKNQLEPAILPSEIPQDITDVVEFTKEYTGKAVELSGVIASKVAETTAQLGTFVAYHAQTFANSAMTEIVSGQSDSDAVVNIVGSVLEVTGSAVNGMGMVHSGLRHAGKVMGKAIANNTVQVVEHVYGPDAGRILGSAAAAVENLTLIGLHSNAIDPEKVIKRTIKHTGKAFLNTPNPNFQPSNFSS